MEVAIRALGRAAVVVFVLVVPFPARAQVTPGASLANCLKTINLELQGLSNLIEKTQTAALGPALGEHLKDPAKDLSKSSIDASLQIQKLRHSSPSYVGLGFEANVKQACDPRVNGQLAHTLRQFLDAIASNLEPVCEKLKVTDFDAEPIGSYLTCAERYADRSAKQRLKVRYSHAPEVLATLLDAFDKNPPSSSKANLDRAKEDFVDTLQTIDHNANSVPDPDTADDPFAKFVRIVFATGPLFPGDFGGLAAADAFCQQRASDYSLPGTYVAWLSDGSTSAASRISHRVAAFALVDGTKIADNWSDLVNGNIDAPIDVGAGGALHENAIWTGTAADGSNAKPALCPNGCNCQKWQGGGTGLQGRSDATDLAWTRAGTAKCDTMAGLYCVQQ